ncbi:MAG: hypothetical protein DRI65_19000 [Chloroflexota bacterium]|nr:MAG: hypothetical protein DRI65_19000 [Chloroflexota bacterium]
MLKIERSNLKMVIYDEEYSVKYPTVRMIRDFTAELKKDEANEFDVTIGLLSTCGLPKDLLLDLEILHLNMIVDEITKQKKS